MPLPGGMPCFFIEMPPVTLWILLLLAVSLSPLVWLLPSHRQRGRMDTRLAARRRGLAMNLSRQDWPHWLEGSPPSPCAQYHRARRPGRGDTWSYWQNRPGEWLNRWREPCTDARLLEQLAGLPADAYRIEAAAQMIGICWGERGGAVDLDRLAAVLDALA
jgi:hypothetical protein